MVAGIAMWAMVDRFHSVRQITGEPVRETDLDVLPPRRNQLTEIVRQSSALDVGRPKSSEAFAPRSWAILSSGTW